MCVYYLLYFYSFDVKVRCFLHIPFIILISKELNLRIFLLESLDRILIFVLVHIKFYSDS